MITKKLIDYLNNDDPYIKYECGIFEISFQRRNDNKIEWEKINELIKSYKYSPYTGITSYCQELLTYSILFETYGLDVTIKIDLLRVQSFEGIKFSNENIYFTTEKILNMVPLVNGEFPYEYSLIEKRIENITCSTFTLSDIKNILVSLFSNEARLAIEQKRVCDCSDIETKIIIDKNSYVLDGKHRLALLYLLNIKRPVNCLQLNVYTKNPTQVHAEQDPKTVFDLIAFIRCNENILTNFNNFCEKVSPSLYVSESNIEVIQQKILTNWISKLVIL